MATFDSTEIDLIARDIQHSDRLKRLTALKQLHAIVQSEMRQRPLNAILDAIYLHLLKCYYDQFESCRSLAIAIVGEFVHKLDARQPFVCEYIVPAIRKRVGLAEMHESSEEVQLQLLGQVAAICARQAATDGDGATRDGGESMVARAHADIADIVVRNLANRFADAQRQCCDIVLRLAVSGNRFAPHAERLVDPLIRMLRHRQSSSRIAAIETLGLSIYKFHPDPPSPSPTHTHTHTRRTPHSLHCKCKFIRGVFFSMLYARGTFAARSPFPGCSFVGA